jgi:hypothetical protein
MTTYGIVSDIHGNREALIETLAYLRARGVERVVCLGDLVGYNAVFGPHDGRALRVALFHDGAKLVGMAPLLARVHRYRLGVPFRRLELLASGEDERDEICSDYLGVVVERGAEEGVVQALVDALAGGALGPWDELALPAMRGDLALPVLLAEALRRRGVHVQTEVSGVAPYVPLPARWDDYLAALPSTRRYLVRRSLRDFEAWAGPVRFERATDMQGLARGMAILTSLHGERWASAGREGAFTSPRFRVFHEGVMPALLARGALDLAWRPRRLAGGDVFGRVEAREVLAQDLLRRVALDALGARVPARDPALGVEQEDRVLPHARDEQVQRVAVHGRTEVRVDLHERGEASVTHGAHAYDLRAPFRELMERGTGGGACHGG